MFSYRHAFHAGNHADVLKHITLLATMRHLMQKEAGITLIDTHSGAGLYRLDGDYSQKGAEAQDGLFKLLGALEKLDSIPEPIEDYLEQIASFNANGEARIYPGSPFLMQRLMRHASRDRLRLFELHPTDSRALMSNIAQLEAGRTVTVSREDGFEALKKLLPPPASATGSKRAMVLIDPSYEIKSDYAKVSNVIADCLKRFPTGTYLVWYPIIPRPEAHELPRRLKTLSNQARRSWLHATLAIGKGAEGDTGLSASGMFVINPPYTLAEQLRAALAMVGPALARGNGGDARGDLVVVYLHWGELASLESIVQLGTVFFGFFAWYRGLAIGPISSVSQVQLTQPVMSILWSAVLLGESITPQVLLGGTVVIACAALAVRSRLAGATSRG